MSAKCIYCTKYPAVIIIASGPKIYQVMSLQRFLNNQTRTDSVPNIMSYFTHGTVFWAMLFVYFIRRIFLAFLLPLLLLSSVIWMCRRDWTKPLPIFLVLVSIDCRVVCRFGDLKQCWNIFPLFLTLMEVMTVTWNPQHQHPVMFFFWLQRWAWDIIIEPVAAFLFFVRSILIYLHHFLLLVIFGSLPSFFHIGIGTLFLVRTSVHIINLNFSVYIYICMKSKCGSKRRRKQQNTVSNSWLEWKRLTKL